MKLTYNDGSYPEFSYQEIWEWTIFICDSNAVNSLIYKSVKEIWRIILFMKLTWNISTLPRLQHWSSGSITIQLKTTDAQKSSTKQAILNKDFRQAVNFAFDREAYAARSRPNPFGSGSTGLCSSEWRRVLGSWEATMTHGDEWKDVNSRWCSKPLIKKKPSGAACKAKEQLQKEGVNSFTIWRQTDNSQVQQASSFKQLWSSERRCCRRYSEIILIRWL